MQSAEAYNQLIDHVKKTTALEQAAGLLSWDQETMMPPSGSEARAEQMGALSSVIHAHKTDARIGDWLAAIDAGSLGTEEAANIRECRKSFARNTKVPERLAQELARETALAQSIWAKARASDDFVAFAPTLKKIIELKREEAEAISSDGQSPYEAMLDDFEPGMDVAELRTLLGNLRTGLIELREKISASEVVPTKLEGTFPDEAQMEMANRLATIFNYDWRGGRIDKAVHPFSSGYRTDSRITTRTSANNPFDCMYSTVHEVGHSNYEQGRDPAMDRQPIGSYASMGMHESQSRMLENQIGRSRPFMDWLFPQMEEVFGEINVRSPEELFQCANRVESGYIRTESDEVHYNLHILLRFELESALIEGDLTVPDLEDAWNEKFHKAFGVAVDRPSNGVLQDVHWSVGLFGYFPTYTLGNIYAAEQFEAMAKDLPTRSDLIAKGELEPIADWLRDNVHRHGNVYRPSDLMEKITGHKASEKPLLTYLNAKFATIYNL